MNWVATEHLTDVSTLLRELQRHIGAHKGLVRRAQLYGVFCGIILLFLSTFFGKGSMERKHNDQNDAA